MKKQAILCFFVLLFAFLSGCDSIGTKEPIKKVGFALDTVIEVTVYDKKDVPAAENVLSLVRDYEKIFSRTHLQSELYLLNAREGQKTAVSDDLFALLKKAMRYAEDTRGAYDFTLGGVSSLYDFTSTVKKAPTEEERNEAMQHVGYQKVHLSEGNFVTVDDPKLVIDLGSIAKGYIGDKVVAYLREQGVESALLNLGGSVFTIGHRPDGEEFSIGIKNPRQEELGSVMTVKSSDNTVITSGTYERSFTAEDGTFYHHLLDTATGKPIQNGLLSTTIVYDNGADADALSTLAFCLGYEGMQRYIRNFHGIRVIFLYEDGHVEKLSNE